MSNEGNYHLNTVNRIRLIIILIGGLFFTAFIVSQIIHDEIQKILILLICLPVIIFCAIRFSRQNSTWEILNGFIIINKGNKTNKIRITEIKYIKNHIRSGGNLITISLAKKGSALRFWRNKLFQADDDFDTFFHHLKESGIPVILG